MGKSVACLKCGCKNRWETSTRPKGYVCGNCDAFLSIEMLTFLMEKYSRSWPSDQQMSGGFATTPPEYGRDEGEEEKVTVIISLKGTYELPLEDFTQEIGNELNNLVDQFEAFDSKLSRYKKE
jgi:hypothetical protein